MKVRLGFVSNSSSSSYWIAIDKHKGLQPCPTCGHQSNGYNFIQRVEQTDDGETAITEGELVIREIEESITRFQEEIRDLENFKSPPAWHTGTKEEYISYQRLGLEQEQATLEQINKYRRNKYELYYLQLSYHNDNLKEEYARLVESGHIVQILYMGD